MREKVAGEYGIALFRRYREKEARGLVGYEASWWKRHRKAGNIPYVEDPGGGIGYFGYMLCDILILGKDATRRDRGDEPQAATPPTDPKPPSGTDGAAVALHILTGER